MFSLLKVLVIGLFGYLGKVFMFILLYYGFILIGIGDFIFFFDLFFIF